MKLVEWYEYARYLVPEDSSHWHDWYFKTSIPPTTSIPPIILETLSEGASKPLSGRIRPATVEMLRAFCFSWYCDNFRGNWAEQTLPAVLKNWGDGWSHPDLDRGDESIPRHSDSVTNQPNYCHMLEVKYMVWRVDRYFREKKLL